MRAVVPWALVAVVAGCQFRISSAAGGDDFAVADLGDAPPDLMRGVPDGAVARGLGWPCDFSSDCDSGQCVDGFCCDSACDSADPANLCKACNVPGSEGHCTAVAAGTDPRGECAPDSVDSCGHDGECDGNGACRHSAAGTACGGTSCANGTITYAPACDGNGTCVPGTTASCAPYVCADATACATTCTPPDINCAPPAVCTNGSCGQRALGQPCTMPSDCASSFCAQGVCCNAACTGSCLSCDVTGKVGTCSPLPSGTQCAPAACSGDLVSSARTCDGAGSCQPAVITSCTPYACNYATAMCFARPCSTNAQCATGHTCNNGSHKCQ